MNDAAEYMVKNADMFLSKKAVNAFGGYSQQQLRRMYLLSNREVTQAKREEFIMATINQASYTFKEKYGFYPEDAIHLFLDDTTREGFEKEIFMDVHLTHYPLRDWTEMWAEMQQIVRSYNKLGARNSKAIEHGKIGKHQMHLARLYVMAFDILYDGKVVTYRDKEHDFFMDVRAGKYITEDNQPTREFMEMVDEWENQLKHAAEHTVLPDAPDYDRINQFKAEVNYSVVMQDSRCRDEFCQ
jgi:predicted nucleotidyltransferase